jgi:hypothetical protein
LILETVCTIELNMICPSLVITASIDGPPPLYGSERCRRWRAIEGDLPVICI